MRLILLSDLHVMAEKSATHWDVNPYENLANVIQHINHVNYQADGIVLMGDISQDYTEQSYHLVSELIVRLNLPIYYLPGNHDHNATMKKVFKNSLFHHDKSIVSDDWHLILLDSTIEGEQGGALSEQELVFLQQQLEKSISKQAMIFMHHHPVKINSVCFDNIMLANGREFKNVIANYPNVKGVVFGHIHQVFYSQIEGVDYFSCPSTFAQIRPLMEVFNPLTCVEKSPPAYRITDFTSDGYTTEVVKL